MNNGEHFFAKVAGGVIVYVAIPYLLLGEFPVDYHFFYPKTPNPEPLSYLKIS